MEYRDPIQQLLIGFYKEKLGRFWKLIIAVVGIAGGVFFVEAFFRYFLGYKKLEAFIYGFSFYVGLISIACLVYGIWLTILLFKNPSQLLGLYRVSEYQLNEWMSKFYGLERTLTKEKCVIKEDGSYDSKMELKMIATVENIHAIEINAEYLGPEPDMSIDMGVTDDNFSVTPQEFGPLHVREVKTGEYEVRFSRALPTDREVTVEYHEKGGPNCFATSRDNYPTGLSFDYILRWIAAPTQRLTIDISFEEGYPLSMSGLPQPIVWYGDAKVEHSREVSRVSNYFRYRDRHATLDMPAPLISLYYVIKWAVD